MRILFGILNLDTPHVERSFSRSFVKRVTDGNLANQQLLFNFHCAETL